jgi:hypothetical protein
MGFRRPSVRIAPPRPSLSVKRASEAIPGSLVMCFRPQPLSLAPRHFAGAYKVGAADPQSRVRQRLDADEWQS